MTSVVAAGAFSVTRFQSLVSVDVSFDVNRR